MGKRKRRPSRATSDRNELHRPEAKPLAVPGVARKSLNQSFKMLLGIICLVAFFLRLLNVLQTFELPTVVQLMGDARGYVDWAEQIAAGDWYGTQTFYQAPLYPYMLAVLIKVFSADTFGLRFFQIILGTVSVGFLGLAGRHAFNRKVGLIAAAMYALYPPAIYYDGIIQKTALASFLLCMLLAACAYLNRHASKRYATLAGITLGLLVLTRENALLWIPVIPVWMALRLPTNRSGKLWSVGSYILGLWCLLQWQQEIPHWAENGHPLRFKQAQTFTSETTCNRTDFTCHLSRVMKHPSTSGPTRSDWLNVKPVAK